MPANILGMKVFHPHQHPSYQGLILQHSSERSLRRNRKDQPPQRTFRLLLWTRFDPDPVWEILLWSSFHPNMICLHSWCSNWTVSSYRCVWSYLTPELFKLRVVEDVIAVPIRLLHHLPGLSLVQPVSPGPSEDLPELGHRDHPVPVEVKQLEGLQEYKESTELWLLHSRYIGILNLMFDHSVLCKLHKLPYFLSKVGWDVLLGWNLNKLIIATSVSFS